MLVIFSEALGAGQTFADKHGYRLDSSQEMIALGLANLGSGFLGGLACGGSLSQTAVNDGAGARSELSPLVAALLSLITVIALTPLFKDLPEAVLAALIIHAVSHLMKVAEMRRYYRLVRREFWLGMLTLAGVIILDVLPGSDHRGGAVHPAGRLPRQPHPAVGPGCRPGSARRLPRPTTPSHGPAHPRGADRPARWHPLLRQRPIGPGHHRVPAVSLPDPIHAVVVDLDANDELDITSSEKLAKLVHDLHLQHVRVGFAHFHAPALDMARRAGVLDELDAAPIFETVAQAVAWAASASPAASAGTAPPDPD